jgi:hypothetical protein
MPPDGEQRGQTSHEQVCICRASRGCLAGIDRLRRSFRGWLRVSEA